MWVTILPFFLAANVIVDDSHHRPEWTMYGPEYTYDVLLNMSITIVTNATDHSCHMIASELKCRPKGQDTLNCYFQNLRPDHRRKKSEYECEYKDTVSNFVPKTHLFGSDDRFEIRFNERGIENLIVPKTISVDKLNNIKTVVNQLDIGFDVKERRKDFKITENWKDSTCLCDIKITHDILESEEDDDDSTGGERFDLAFASSKNDHPEPEPITEIFRVDKIRKIATCPKIYSSGYYSAYSNINAEVKQMDTSRVASTSHITISKKNFVSSTTVDGVSLTGESRTLKIGRSISMKLKRIDFARSSLPEIKDPVSASKFVSSRVEAN